MTSRFYLLILLFLVKGSLPVAGQNVPPFLGISHIAVKATDVEKSVAFYRDFLGFVEQGRLNHLDDGSLQLVFMKVSDTQWIEIFDGKRYEMSDRIHQISFRVNDAEEMRVYLEKKGIRVPARVNRGQIRNFGFTVKDPHNYNIEIQQYTPEGWIVRDLGKFLPETRISDHIAHAAVIVDDMEASRNFYCDVLGFKESWRGSADGKVLSWVHVKMPDNPDFLELMLNPGSAPHFCLEVPDIEKARSKLMGTAYFPNYQKTIETKTGKNQKRQLNLYDPEGIRVELMEPNTVDGKPAPSSDAPFPKKK
jgi:catechol 2,3-dioxygenase-like lactoylglutathione lyase family enzyme